MNSFISADSIKFEYKNIEGQTQLALDGLNIKIDKGEFVAVLGHNGSGKSTFAKHMNAILVPTEGKLTVKGMDTADDDLLYDIRQCVGMVFQNPDNQLVATVVEEDVAFAPENLGVPREEIRKRVDDALEAVGMTKYKLHATYKLSGGQKQRVAIGGIIAMRPECIVLDEPTAMLDPVGRKEVMKSIRMLNRDLGITIVLITHHMNEAAEADRVIVMSKGKVIMDAPPKEVFWRTEELYDAGLSVPQPVELLLLMRKDGAEIEEGVLTVEECAEALAKIIKSARK
ncbi:MAG: energy-coupling factor transporter ATPase [Clostridiales bacterium]|nr:energy-coupling factor transporter ATPase [Clostridiales bacterium]